MNIMIAILYTFKEHLNCHNLFLIAIFNYIINRDLQQSKIKSIIALLFINYFPLLPMRGGDA